MLVTLVSLDDLVEYKLCSGINQTKSKVLKFYDKQGCLKYAVRNICTSTTA